MEHFSRKRKKQIFLGYSEEDERKVIRILEAVVQTFPVKNVFLEIF